MSQSKQVIIIFFFRKLISFNRIEETHPEEIFLTVIREEDDHLRKLIFHYTEKK